VGVEVTESRFMDGFCGVEKLSGMGELGEEAIDLVLAGIIDAHARLDVTCQLIQHGCVY
jgi:hypothetical protein